MASGSSYGSYEGSTPPGEDKSGLPEGNWQGNVHLGFGGQGTVHCWVQVDANQKVIDRIVIKDSWSTDDTEEPEIYKGIYNELVRKGMSMSDAIFGGSSRIPFYKEAYVQGLLTPESRLTQSNTVRMRGYRRGNEDDPKGVAGSIHWRIYMDHCYAGDLWDFIEDYKEMGKPIPEPFIWWTMECLASALVQMETCARARPHAREQQDETIVLLDMKPPNVLIDAAGQSDRYPMYPQVKVSDFGSAHITYRDDPENRFNDLDIVFTRGFLAPELDRPYKPKKKKYEEIFDGDEDDDDELTDDEDIEEGGLSTHHDLGDLGGYKVVEKSSDHHSLGALRGYKVVKKSSDHHTLDTLGGYKVAKISDGDEDEESPDHEDMDESESVEGRPLDHHSLGALGGYKIEKIADGDRDGDGDVDGEGDGEGEGDDGGKSSDHRESDDSVSVEDEKTHFERPDVEDYDMMDVYESFGHDKMHSKDGDEGAADKEDRDEEDEEREADGGEGDEGEDGDKEDGEGDGEDEEEEFTALDSWTNVWQLGRTIEVMMRLEELTDCNWGDSTIDRESQIKSIPPRHRADPGFSYSEALTDLVWQCQQFDPEARPTPENLLSMIKTIAPFHNHGMDLWGTEDWVAEQYEDMGTLTEDHKKFMKGNIKQRADAGKLWFLQDFEDRNLAAQYRELDLDIPPEGELEWQPEKFRHRIGQVFGADGSEAEPESESSEESKRNKRPRSDEAITVTRDRKRLKV
jgi:serine/threonine protein kinase